MVQKVPPLRRRCLPPVCQLVGGAFKHNGERNNKNVEENKK